MFCFIVLFGIDKQIRVIELNVKTVCSFFDFFQSRTLPETVKPLWLIGDLFGHQKHSWHNKKHSRLPSGLKINPFTMVWLLPLLPGRIGLMNHGKNGKLGIFNNKRDEMPGEWQLARGSFPLLWVTVEKVHINGVRSSVDLYSAMDVWTFSLSVVFVRTETASQLPDGLRWKAEHLCSSWDEPLELLWPSDFS